MPILAGIDEAGLGPVLGPMVTSAVLLDVPAALVTADLWQALADGIASKPLVREPRLVVADSKRLSAREDGLVWLERGALGLLACQDSGSVFPPTCLKLLETLAPDDLSVLADCPWYGPSVNLPVAAEHDGLILRSQRLQRCLIAAGVRVAGVWSAVLFEPAFNAWIERTNNKATVCWQQTARLIRRAVEAGAGVIHVDRQGGRQFYLDKLMPLVEGGRWQVRHETEAQAAYRWDPPAAGGPPRSPVEITFSTGAEKLSLPVAWASLVCKYVREVFMHRLNRFFVGHLPDLHPTAGYLPDGLRFLEAVTPTLQRLNISPERLRRVR